MIISLHVKITKVRSLVEDNRRDHWQLKRDKPRGRTRRSVIRSAISAMPSPNAVKLQEAYEYCVLPTASILCKSVTICGTAGDMIGVVRCNERARRFDP